MAEAQHNGSLPDRPFGVTLVLLGVFLSGLINGWRALGLIRQSGLLLNLGADPDPRLCAAGSAAWASLFLGLAYALWRRKSYSRFVVPFALLAYGLYQFVLPGPCPSPSFLLEDVPLRAILHGAAVLYSALVLNRASGLAYLGPANTEAAGVDQTT